MTRAWAIVVAVTLLVLACSAPSEPDSAPARHPPLSKFEGPLSTAIRDYFRAIEGDERTAIAAYLEQWFDAETLERRGLEGWTDSHLDVARQIGPLDRAVVVDEDSTRCEVLTRLADRSEAEQWLAWTFLRSTMDDGGRPRLRGVRVKNAAPPDTWDPVFVDSSAEALVTALRDRLGLPAVGVSIRHADGRIESAVSGVRRIDGDAPATTADLFHFGSCTKSVTALLVQSLVDQGLLDWSDTLGALLGTDFDIDAAYRDVPLSAVARHRAGLVGHSDDIADAIARYGKLPGSPREQREAYLREVLARPAGVESGRTHYSNAGFTLLAHVCERLLDRPYEELVAERVLRPRGVEGAWFGWPAAVDRPDGIWGHAWEDGELVVFEGDTRLGAFLAPAGDLSLTLADFARVAAAWVDLAQVGELVDTLPGSSFGAGVGVSTRHDLRFVGHAGSTGVYWAKFRAWPDLGIVVVVAANGPVDDLGERAVHGAFDAVVRESRGP